MTDDQLTQAASKDLTLRDRAQGLIRDAILDGHFRPGQKLVERELSALTGVSRSVLRECLSHLEAKGLVERQSFRGFSVAQLSEGKVKEIYELRLPIEALAAELFTARATQGQLDALRAAMIDLEESVTSFDVRRVREVKEHYYDILFAGCGNSEIRRALENVIDRIYYLRGQTMQDPSRRAASLREMRRLTDGLVSRNAQEARAACLAHICSARDAMIERVEKSNSRYNVKSEQLAC